MCNDTSQRWINRIRHAIEPLIILRCALFGAALLFPSVATAQYRFDSWTTENGLPQNSVYSITQTRDGYLWFTTLDGVVRYDGTRFTIFNKGNTRGINTNRFTTLFEDASGNLLIGTEDGGLTRYRDGAFVTYTTSNGLPHNWVSAMRDDGNGGTTVATGGGVVRYLDGAFLPYSPKPDEPGDRFGYRDSSGTLWYFDADRIYNTTDGLLTSYPLGKGLAPVEFPASFPGVYAGTYRDKEGNLWSATRQNGLIRFKDGALRVYTAKDGLPVPYVTAISEDRHGSVWMGTYGGGLIEFRDGIFRTYTTADGLSSNYIRAIYEDREGTVWIGTLDRGLDRLTKQVIHTEREGLSGRNVYPIFQDKAGAIWIGTSGAGLNRYRDGAFTHYNQRNGLLDNRITALAEDEQGRLWIGSVGGVVYLKGGTFTDFTDNLGLPGKVVPPGTASQNPVNVRAILQDHTGAMWFGTESHGLVRYKDGETTVYTTRDGLPGNEIRVIIEDRRGNLWIGTYGGLGRFQDGRFSSYTEKDGLGSARVRALYEDRDGILWIGTYDGGLSRLLDGKITTSTTRNGLFNNGVFQILEDDRGNFWMSCNLGIYRVSRAQLNDFAEGKIQAINSIPYTKQDGLFTVECNGGIQPAGIKSRDGRLWFPTQDGLAIVDPENVLVNPAPPPVVIEGAALDREPVDVHELVDIDASRENLEIHYAGLSFIKPELVSFRYRMEGLDKDWIDAGSRRVAYYSHLPPGKYTFRVIAANSDGVWNVDGAAIRVTVIPPFWRTWWFTALAILSGAALGVLIYEWRLRRLKRERTRQDAFSRQLIDSQESERKRIAAELHDSLGQSLAIIKNRALLGFNGPADHAVVKQQFNQISEHAAHAIEEVKEISYNLRPYLLDRLGLTRALNSMLNKVAASSGIRFDTDIDDLEGLFSNEAEISFYRIIQESVNNIIKHSEATEAMVVVKIEDGEVALTVQDNGKGFVLEQADGGLPTGRGFGLTGIAERARILGARQETHSEVGCGTTLTLKIRLKEGDKERRDEE